MWCPKEMKMNDFARASLLYDFYGGLLTEHKREIMELYHEEDLSLAEIAMHFDISRAAVHDALKSGERQLERYEKELGLVREMIKREEAKSKILSIINNLEINLEKNDVSECNADFREGLKNIKHILKNLERE